MTVDQNAITIPAAEARKRFGELLDRAGFQGQRYIITKHGHQAVAALVPIEDLYELKRLKSDSKTEGGQDGE